jgi:hypothetical protein
MNDWAEFLAGEPAKQVIKLRRARNA